MDIKVGDKVSVAKWEATVPRMGRLLDPAIVTSIERGQACETGTMVWVKGASGQENFLDLNWLLPYEP